MTRSEHYCRMVQNRHFLLPELSGSQAFHFDERTEVYLQAVLLSYIEIWRFLRRWPGLRNQNFLYLQCLKFLLQEYCS